MPDFTNIDAMQFFDRRPRELALYQDFERRVLAACPDTHIRVQKTQITFENRHGFAFVSLPRRKVQQPDYRRQLRPVLSGGFAAHLGRDRAVPQPLDAPYADCGRRAARRRTAGLDQRGRRLCGGQVRSTPVHIAAAARTLRLKKIVLGHRAAAVRAPDRAMSPCQSNSCNQYSNQRNLD